MDADVFAECLPSGAEKVIEWFGCWPSFHDAEVVSVSLARRGPSRLRVYPYCPEKPASIDFVMEDVADVDLNDFSQQNVIFDLSVRRAGSEANGFVFCVLLSPCFGLSGTIKARSLRVELVPGKSQDGVSLW